MLDRIDVDVIDVPRKICFVADEVFPIPPLPYAALAFALSAFGAALAMRQATREHRFDQPPTQCEIAVAGW
ncbi:MAG: hypothetical protein A3H31_11910 [Gallionellales bacterium RIFCSPLOWO2_02_FULL_57_47]|nr:MAG: hypothetical protein A3H31_11910 [Gallionellales bacterium RIFCSPLOWO2_02_FULL_57_47]OGT16743.1 MAG: hypothetical protein A3J49_08695 [Gallionellales bacterium RIFCSPHIGHO2_02_FULL_57_16]